MKIILYNKNNYNKQFVYNYLKHYMLKLVDELYSSKKCKQLSQKLNVNILSVIKYSINTLIISTTNDSYILSINKNIRYKDYNLKALINYINYGDREIKGYRLLYNIFEYVVKNIDSIYKEWLDGY